MLTRDGAPETWPLGGRACWAVPLGAGAGPLPLIVLFAGEPAELLPPLADFLAPALAAGRCPPFVLAGYGPVDWDADYTPWPVQDPTGRVFSGGAARQQPFLTLEFLPALAARFPLDGRVFPVGYSLGGLAALYHHCELGFSGCGCCSGSLWYPGWLPYLQAHAPAGPVYLSVGGKEKNTRHPWMCRVEDAAAASRQLLARAAPAVFVKEPGGHSHQVPQRIGHAILWLLRQQSRPFLPCGGADFTREELL